MRILTRLPYAAERTTVSVREETVRVRAYQIMTWVSLSARDILTWDRRPPRFPAVLDTGHNHNFAIGRGQLLRWAGLSPEALLERGTIRERGQRVPLHAARLWLHRNEPGTQLVPGDGEPFE